MVQSVDLGVGDITKALIRYDMLRNTIIMFTSDNGGAPIVGGYNYPFRGAKGSQWEGGVHVAGFLFAPGLVPSQDFSGLFHISDWSPTIQSMVGGRHPQLDEIDGQDQSKALAAQGPGERDSVVVEWNVPIVNMTGVVERIDGVTWKLVAGSTIEIGLFCKEPVDKWSINAEGATRLDQFEQIQRDYISWMNPDLFPMEWAIHFGMVETYDKWFGTSFSPLGDRLPKNMTSEADTYYNLPVTVEWDRVWLFNLDKDRTETTNVALQNKAIVQQIVDKYNEKFKDIDPQAASVYYMFGNMISMLDGVVKVGILLMPVLGPSHALISKLQDIPVLSWLASKSTNHKMQERC